MEGAKNPFGCFAGAEPDAPTSPEGAPPLGNEPDGSRAHRGGMTPQHGFPPHLPACGQRTGHDQVHLTGRGSRGPSRIIRPAHLTQNLGLAEHLRIETCGYDEEMANSIRAIVSGESR